MHYKYTNFSLLDPLIQYIFLPITYFYYTVLQKKGNLCPRFYRAQMQLTKFSKLKIIHTPGKNLTVADMRSRTFTKEQLQIHQLRHKQLPPQIHFSIMKDNQPKLVHYLVKHEKIKYNQKNDCHPILAGYGEDQFSIRINNKGEDIHIKPLDSFSFQSIVPFESKYQRPKKIQTKSLLQQSTILNDTDILSDEDEPNQSQNMINQNPHVLKEQTLAIQYPTKSDYCIKQNIVCNKTMLKTLSFPFYIIGLLNLDLPYF